jgi:glycosyltransferase involved in cell wall biosynthesis
MEKRFKVLLITAWYPTKEFRVGGDYVREHAKAVSLFDDLVLLHMAGKDQTLRGWWAMEKEMDQSLTAGIPTYRICYRQPSIPKVSYFISIWSMVQAFRRIVSRGFRPDIIHAHVYEAAVPAVIIGKLYGIPVVVTEHSSEFPRKLLSRFKIWKARISFRLAELVMPVSGFLQRAIEADGIKARFQVVPNVVDTTLFYSRDDLMSEKNVKRLLVVSLLDPHDNKGLPFLFKALDRLRLRRHDWRLDVVGDGPARPRYEQMVNDLGFASKVTFQGIKTKKEVAELMRKSDILVLPSLVETFSIAAAEALSTGIPVLATKCGGPEDFLSPETGCTVAPGSAEALCDGLDYMLDNFRRFSSKYMSSYCASLFSPEQIGKRFHSVYLAAINKAWH